MKPQLLSLFSLMLILSINATSIAQNSTIPETREIILNYSDTIQKIRIFVINPKLKPLANKVYAWYQKQTVLHTEGAWSGKLLHDKCESFYPNNNLLEQGYYKRGGKQGQWKKWYSDGTLKEKTNWKAGQLHGAVAFYDVEGKLQEQGQYVKGHRHGLFLTWTDGKENKEKYRKGKLIVKKKKVPKPKKAATSKAEKTIKKTPKKKAEKASSKSKEKNNKPAPKPDEKKKD